jgi:hypothetical protein
MLVASKALRAAFLAASIALIGASDASASTWAQRHPRRAEVNHRLANQRHRINHELREGEITRGRARALHRQDRFVRREERFMARHDHGHVTRAEQRALNQQENGIGREIGR